MVDKFSFIETKLKQPHQFTPLKKVLSKNNGYFTHSKSSFFEMVRESKKMIRSGDIFQILISNRYIEQFENIDAISFYRLLKIKNPSPYMFFMDYGEFFIIGSSPEVMVRLTEGEILLRPIAGTRKRGKTIKRDKELEQEMLSDPKEKAEHLMLIDLGRNDVGRVAKIGTVTVPNIMRVERYSHVMHMVTDILAEIDNKKFDMFDLLKATFTAGTMTGAPKIRAMELIAEYEKIKRNFYSGTIALFGFNGNMDSAITIRTALLKDKTLYFQAGAGIVADSKEELEFLEVQNKMNALFSTLKELKDL
jgi:anthranilate synthase component 1